MGGSSKPDGQRRLCEHPRQDRGSLSLHRWRLQHRPRRRRPLQQHGNSNTASGYGALYSKTEGSANTATGVYALALNTSGGYNTATGVAALNSNTSGSYNTATGLNALLNDTEGSGNTANGVDTLLSNTTGPYNTASGYGALYANQAGSSNTAVGYNALYNSIGDGNTAIGANANSSGTYNTVIGIGTSGGTYTNGTALGAGALLTALQHDRAWGQVNQRNLCQRHVDHRPFRPSAQEEYQGARYRSWPRFHRKAQAGVLSFQQW